MITTIAYCLIAASTRAKLIAFGWDDPTIESYTANAKDFQGKGYDGLVVRFRDSSGKYPLTNLLENTSITSADIEEAARKLGKAHAEFPNFQIYIHITANPGVSWFDRTAWIKILTKARLASKLLGEGKASGILLDCEPYTNYEPFFFAMQNGGGKSYVSLQNQVRYRSQQLIKELSSSTSTYTIIMPRMLSWGKEVAAMPKPQRLKIYPKAHFGLYVPFVQGLLDKAPLGVHFVEGNEDSYRFASVSEFATEAVRTENNFPMVLEPRTLAKYRTQVQCGFSLYLDAFVSKPGSSYHIDPVEGSVPKAFANVLKSASQYATGPILIYAEQGKRWAVDKRNVPSWESQIPGLTSILRDNSGH